MSTTLLWSCFADADCDSFNLYRAITGLTVAFPNSLVIGDKLVFSATSPTQQVVTLSGTTVDTLVADILAQAKGLTAVKKSDNSAVFIRATSSHEPRFQLYPCTFATHTGQLPRIIVPRKEYVLVANRTRDVGVFDYSYLDADGDPLDWYRMTNLTGSTESIPTLDMQALVTPESLCVVAGRVIDPQNRPVVQARVVARILPQVKLSDNSGIAGREIEVFTDVYGRFAMPLLQKHTVLFQIHCIGYNQVVQIPAAAYVLFKDLVPVNDQLYLQDRSSFCVGSEI